MFLPVPAGCWGDRMELWRQFSTCLKDKIPVLIPLQPRSSDIHNHPVVELSAEKFWAFSGQKPKEYFKCVCFVFQKCWEKKRKVRAKEEIRRWNCANPPPSTGQGSIKMVLTPLSSKEFQSFPRSCCNHFAGQLSLTFLNPSSNEVVMLYPISLSQSQMHKQIPFSM